MKNIIDYKVGDIFNYKWGKTDKIILKITEDLVFFDPDPGSTATWVDRENFNKHIMNGDCIFIEKVIIQ